MAGVFNLDRLNGENGYYINKYFFGDDIYKISKAGDFNGDGVGDYAYTSYFGPNAEERGELYVVFGNSSFNGKSISPYSFRDGKAGFNLIGDRLEQHLGYQVSFIGDYNNDGFSDLAITDNPSDLSIDSNVFIIFGNNKTIEPGFLNNYPEKIITLDKYQVLKGINGTFNPGFGYSVHGGYDFNGDGYKDLVIGYPFFTTSNSSGAVTIIFGNQNAGLQDTITILNDVKPLRSRFGFDIKFIGDLNQDGIDDLGVGDPTIYMEHPNQGAVNVIYGSRNYDKNNKVYYLSEINNRSAFFGNGKDDYFGTSIVGDFDFDGNGKVDLLIGAPQVDKYMILKEDYPYNLYFGMRYIAIGSNGYIDLMLNNGKNYTQKQIHIYDGTCGTAEGGATFGWKVDTVDINNDKLGDIVVSLPNGGHNDDTVEAGCIYIGLGKKNYNPINNIQSVNLEENFDFVRAANSMDNIGDINGDGGEDIGLTFPYYQTTQYQLIPGIEGAGVVYGKSILPYTSSSPSPSIAPSHLPPSHSPAENSPSPSGSSDSPEFTSGDIAGTFFGGLVAGGVVVGIVGALYFKYHAIDHSGYGTFDS